VSCVDIETNSADDWAENLWIYNNTCDYQEAAFHAVGSGIMAQQRGQRSGGLRIVNNSILGNSFGGLTSGIFFTGAFPDGIVAANYIQRAVQPCFQLYGARETTFQDNQLNTCGGGGNPAVLMDGGGNNVWLRNPITVNVELGGSTSTDIWEINSTGNRFDVPTVRSARRRP